MNKNSLLKNVPAIREELLLGALKTKKATKNMNEYCQFMFSLLKPVLKFDKACLNFFNLENGSLGELKSYLHNLPEQVIQNYEKTSHCDFFTPRVINKIGMGIATSNLIPYNEFIESKIYTQHCHLFEMEHTICLIGSIPFHTNQYIALYLFNSDSKIFFTAEETDLINALASTIISNWLYQMDLFDEQYMKSCSLLLNKFDNAPKQLKLLKLVVNYPTLTTKEYATMLGIGKKTVDKELAEIFNKFEITGYGKNKQVKLLQMFPFLTQFSLPSGN